MEIINLDNRDYHMHTLNFSDGINTVDELVRFAGEIGLTEIAITDHSDASLEKSTSNPPSRRRHINRWNNVHNNVNVIFGVEGDLLNEKGDCCFDIQGSEGEFLILSLHKKIYNGNLEKVTEAYINAIKKYHKKIKFIGHPCLKDTCEFLDIKLFCEVANKYNIPLEINGAGLKSGKINLEKHKKMLEYGNKFYINSDAHNLYELKEMRGFAMKYLEKEGYINK